MVLRIWELKTLSLQQDSSANILDVSWAQNMKMLSTLNLGLETMMIAYFHCLLTPPSAAFIWYGMILDWYHYPSEFGHKFVNFKLICEFFVL